MSKNVGVDFWIALPIAGILASLVGLIVSLPTLKLSGIYLSIVTLGASEIIRIIAQTWTPVTGGALGIKQIPYPNFFGLEMFKPKYYYFIFLILHLTETPVLLPVPQPVLPSVPPALYRPSRALLRQFSQISQHRPQAAVHPCQPAVQA